MAKERATLESHGWLYVFCNPGLKLSIHFDNAPSLFFRWAAASRMPLTLHAVLYVEKTADEIIVCHIERTRLAGAQAEPQRKEDPPAVRGDGRQDSVLHFKGHYAWMVADPATAREVGDYKTQALGCAFVDKREKPVESAQHLRDCIDVQSPHRERGEVLVNVAAIEFENRPLKERLPVVRSPPLVFGQGVRRTLVALHPVPKVI
jgi:hypothetical protein